MTSQSTTARRPHIFYAAILTVLTLWMSIPGLSTIQVTNRDEARYVQATVQMVDSGDYINIQYQDEPRHKKPAGIYWMQAASVKAFGGAEERVLWPHRIPSVLGALLAVLATYWGGVAVYGRRGAFIGAGILAVSALFVFEAHIAKTDAMLCGLSALTLACLLHLRRRPSAKIAVLLWAALGIGVMIKGPMVPALLILTLLSLAIWERQIGWMKRLVSWPGIILCALIIVPWAIMIGLATDGAFFKEAFAGDLAPKLAGGQESHGSPPGYYLLTTPILFWPGSLILLCGLVFGFKASRQKDPENEAMTSSVRLLLAWAVPFWLLLEIVPTKLPHYLLPAYPAFALLCAGAVMAMLQVKAFSVSRRIGSAVFFVVSLFLIIAIIGGDTAYAAEIGISKWFVIPLTALAFLGTGFMWTGRMEHALITGLALSALLTTLTYFVVAPRVDTFFIAHKIETAMKSAGLNLPRKGGPQVYSPHFTEPSLVYRLGTDIILGDRSDTFIEAGLEDGSILLFNAADKKSKTALQKLRLENCFEDIGKVKGINYSNGDAIDLSILQSKTCQQPEEIIAPPETP